MKEINVSLWDEGLHTVLAVVTVRGTRKNIAKIERAVEGGVHFIADGKSPWRTASEFIRQHRFHFND